MALVANNVLRMYTLEDILITNPINSLGWTLRLYDNDYTPVPSDDGTSFNECTFTGYSNLSMSGGVWDTPVLDGDTAKSEYLPLVDPISFTNGGASATVIYGYYVTNDADSSVLFAERFDATVTLDPTQSFNLFLNFWCDGII